VDDKVDKRKVVREMRYFGIDVNESDLQGPPPSRDEVMRRVANNVALGLLAKVPRPTTYEINREISYEALVIAACDWVGPEAAEIRTFPEDAGKVDLLFGMVCQEVEKEAGAGIRCTLTPSLTPSPPKGVRGRPKLVNVKLYR